MNSVLVRKLEQLGPLSDQERSVVENASFAVLQLKDDQDLVCEGSRSSYCPLLLDGLACQYKSLENGQRQIMAFHVPADLCNLSNVLLGQLDCNIGTLTPVRVAMIPNATLLSWITHNPGLRQLLWRASLIDAAVSREWIVNVGRRTAYQRTAHLLCEMVQRLHPVGLASGQACELPLTQFELADALGLTPVHVNRMLQWLRGEHLIEFSNGMLLVRSWRELKQAAGFDPAYLHQSTVSRERYERNVDGKARSCGG